MDFMGILETCGITKSPDGGTGFDTVKNFRCVDDSGDYALLFRSTGIHYDYEPKGSKLSNKLFILDNTTTNLLIICSNTKLLNIADFELSEDMVVLTIEDLKPREDGVMDGLLQYDVDCLVDMYGNRYPMLVPYSGEENISDDFVEVDVKLDDVINDGTCVNIIHEFAQNLTHMDKKKGLKINYYIGSINESFTQYLMYSSKGQANRTTGAKSFTDYTRIMLYFMLNKLTETGHIGYLNVDSFLDGSAATWQINVKSEGIETNTSNGGIGEIVTDSSDNVQDAFASALRG